MLSINTNLTSLAAQRRLSSATSAFVKSTERLSSGQRINSASDDAAGLAVADRLKANQRILGVASRNISDAVSAVAIMDGALDSQTQILNRLYELAEQSANGSFSNTQRKSLDREYQQLLAEMGRIADTTAFNGLSLLRDGRGGQSSTIRVQVGMDGSANSRIEISGIDVARFAGALNFSQLATIDWDQDSSTYDPIDLDKIQNGQTRDELIARLNNQALTISVRDSAGRARDVIIGFMRDTSDSGVEILAFVEQTDGSFRATTDTVNNAVNLQGDALGTYQFDGSGKLIGADNITINTGLGTNINLDFSALVLGLNQSSTAIDFTGVSTQTQARSSLDVISRKIADLSLTRSKLGASESRLGVAASLVTASRDVLAGAESRIRSADIAEESAQAVRATILQQVAASIMSQANQQPQLALQLLRG